MNEYITIEFLGSFIGMVAALNLIVQFLKPKIDKVKKIHTRYVVWLISLLLSGAYLLITGDIGKESIFLLILNSFVLTMAAMGSYESVVKKFEK